MKSEQKKIETYELQPPEGGWGYLIAAALTIGCNVTLIPMVCFGLIFGEFLASIGDETTGTTLANGIFNTCFNITGLAANHLLQRYSYRVVAFMGGCLFFIGSFCTIFVTNLTQMVISFGVIQGLGMGLLFPAMFTALNSYFNKRLSLINSVAQSFMVAASIVFPYFAQFLLRTYGFRGTVAIISAMSFNTILAAFLLQPVEWHMKKKLITTENEELLLETKVDEKFVMPKPRTSIISVGDRALSVTTINKLGKLKDESFWQTLVKTLDLGMFKDPVYVNIAMGMSLGFTADVAFISIIPLVLFNAGLDQSQVAFLIAIFFACDLAARITLSVVSALCKIRSRLIFLGAAILIIVFRTAFILRDDFHWKMVTIGALGFLRCFIQTPLPTIISEQYTENFATAFSLYMAVAGVVSLIFGPLMSIVKSWTGSDVMVVHLLTLAYLTCVVSWSVELLFSKIKKCF